MSRTPDSWVPSPLLRPRFVALKLRNPPSAMRRLLSPEFCNQDVQTPASPAKWHEVAHYFPSPTVLSADFPPRLAGGHARRVAAGEPISKTTQCPALSDAPRKLLTGRNLQRLTITHVRRWVEHHHRVGYGSVYQGRYKSFPVQDDAHFSTLVRSRQRRFPCSSKAVPAVIQKPQPRRLCCSLQEGC